MSLVCAHVAGVGASVMVLPSEVVVKVEPGNRLKSTTDASSECGWASGRKSRATTCTLLTDDDDDGDDDVVVAVVVWARAGSAMMLAARAKRVGVMVA